MDKFKRSIMDGMLLKEQLKITPQQSEVFACVLNSDIDIIGHHATISARRLYFLLKRSRHKGKNINMFLEKMERFLNG